MTSPSLSPSTHRALHLPRPAWRGRMHRWAAYASVPVGTILVATAPAGRARWAAAVFALTVTAMFTASSLVHLRRWSVPVYERLFRLDHTAIFGLLVGTTIPVAHAIDGAGGRLLAIAMTVGAALAIASVWMPFHPPRGLMNTLFISLGWLPVLATPAILDALGGVGFGFIAAGGAVYTVGAVIVGLQRPDPDPLRFGYHEVWHVMVIVAVALHYVAIAGYALPA